MRIALLGASGPTGQQVLAQAVATGHEVAAIVRREGSVAERGGVRVTVADVTSSADLSTVFRDVDVVISCLGAPYSWKPISLYSDSTRAIIDAMRAASVRRLVTVSSGMTHPIWQGGVRWQKPVYAILRNGPGRTLYADMRRMEDTLAGAHDIEWTVMRPARLTDEIRPGDQLQRTLELPDGRGMTTRQDLAAAILAEFADPHPHEGVFVTTR